MKKHAIAISVGIGALLLIWGVVLLSGSDEQPTPAQAPIDAPAPIPTPEETTAAPRAEPEPPGAEPTPAPEAPPARQRIPGDQAAAAADAQARPETIGPVEELKTAYQSDPRDPEAGAMEERIRGHLKQVEIPEGLVRRVSCVKSACKLEVNWTSDHRHGYMIAMMSLISHVSQQVAAEPVGDDDGQAVHPVDVYVSRVVPPYTPPVAN